MSMNQKALQKKRERREQKRKETKKRFRVALLDNGFSRDWANAVQCPIADVFVPDNLFEIGIGNLFISRRMLDGRYAVGIFLIDTYCLGVKNAAHMIMDSDEYKYMVATTYAFLEGGKPVRQHPAYLRKLVEDAESYAKDLGFAPHEDYEVARMIFSDIDAAACSETFVFGRDGKPFYVVGPEDTSERQAQILEQLKTRCGEGGFDFISSFDDDDFDEPEATLFEKNRV
jgi:hypothetical protein